MNRRGIGGTRRAGFGLAASLALVAAGTFAQPAAAQYFGRNKVQYDDFSFRVLKTPTSTSTSILPRKKRSAGGAHGGALVRCARMFQHEFETCR
jgi:hypothetical protein